MENVRYKIVKPDLKTVDKDAGTVHAVLSTENRDRDGDIIRQKHWDWIAFLAHPALIDSHDYVGLNNLIGSWKNLDLIPLLDASGKQVKDLETGEDVFNLEADANYFLGKNLQSDYAFFLVTMGLGSYSVGFIPDFEKAEEIEQGKSFMGFEFRGQELLEASQVTIPSNRESLQAIMGGRQAQKTSDAQALGDMENNNLADTIVDRLKDDFSLIASRLDALENPPTYTDIFTEALARAQEAR